MRRDERDEQRQDVLRCVEPEHSAERHAVEEQKGERAESGGDPERESSERHLHVVGDDSARHHRTKNLGIGDVAFPVARSANAVFGAIEHLRRDEDRGNRRVTNDRGIRHDRRSEHEQRGEGDRADGAAHFGRYVHRDETKHTENAGAFVPESRLCAPATRRPR